LRRRAAAPTGSPKAVGYKAAWDLSRLAWQAWNPRSLMHALTPINGLIAIFIHLEEPHLNELFESLALLIFFNNCHVKNSARRVKYFPLLRIQRLFSAP
jgi:hypothetical protein